MRRHFIRIAKAAALVAAGVLSFQVQAQQSVRLDLPAQPLAESLRQLGFASNTNIVFDPGLVAGIEAPAFSGTATAEEALARLLAGTQLRYKFVDEKTVSLMPAGAGVKSTAVEATSLPAANGERNIAGLRIAQAEEVTPEAYGTDAAGRSEEKQNASGTDGDAKDAQLEEIVVTAQKRVERMQEVPVPVTVINTESLASSSQLRLQDYYNKIPGLGLALIGDGSAPTLTIRGITTGGLTNPTVGVVVDEVSYGQTVNPGVSPAVPDIDPGDLARVEVLRGPQGTLYGAASMGGLLKYVTVDPSTDAVKGSMQVGFSDVRHGDDLGYSLRGSVNVPLGDTFAVRASGFTTRQPGYIENIQTGEEDVNRRDSNGGRLSALWRPSERVSLKLSALIQKSERDGTQDVDVALGADDPKQMMLADTGVYVRDTEAYSATLTASLGRVDLTSATGYNVDVIDTALDQTAARSALALLNFGVSDVRGPLHRNTEKFTQEVRAVIPVGRRIQWLFGGFFTHEDALLDLNQLAINPAGAAVGAVFTNTIPGTYEEHAAFTNVTVDITDRLDVQFGGRANRTEQSFSAVRTGPLAVVLLGVSPSIQPKVTADDDAFTYLVTPRFRISPDVMVYARLASGYRPGGPNPSCGAVTVPCQYGADTTENYEIGLKGDAFDGAFSLDASVYYIDWKDIQVNLFDRVANLQYTDNAARAKSQGVELSVESKPWTGMTFSVWGAWNDAELTEGFPTTLSTVAGRPGDRLPYSSRFSGNLSLEQAFPLGVQLRGFLGGSLSYVGDRKGVFRSATQVRETFPSYSQVDVRMGFWLDSWTLSAFVNNVTDKRGVLRSGRDSIRPTYLTYIEPRTVGLSLTKTF